MKPRLLCVVGNGGVVGAISDYASTNDLPNYAIPYNVVRWPADMVQRHKIDKPTFVHVGSGRQYAETLASAEKSCGIYIQAATKSAVEMPVPDGRDYTFIQAPNLSSLVVKTLLLSRQLGRLFANEEKEIIESHQSSKRSIAGTAQRIAENLGIPYEDIRSIRDPKTQAEELQIKHLDRHAFHRVTIRNGDSSLEITLRVEGLQPYVEGLFKIAKWAEGIGPGVFHVEDLARKMLL